MKTILIFLISLLIVYFLFHLFFRYILPWLLKRWIKSLMKKPQDTSIYDKIKREGEITVDYITSENDSGSDFKDSGEYVDFEEIDKKEKT